MKTSIIILPFLWMALHSLFISIILFVLWNNRGEKTEHDFFNEDNANREVK